MATVYFVPSIRPVLTVYDCWKLGYDELTAAVLTNTSHCEVTAAYESADDAEAALQTANDEVLNSICGQ